MRLTEAMIAEMSDEMQLAECKRRAHDFRFEPHDGDPDSLDVVFTIENRVVRFHFPVLMGDVEQAKSTLTEAALIILASSSEHDDDKHRSDRTRRARSG